MTKSKELKQISYETYLRALALFTTANQNYLRADAYGMELADLLGQSVHDGNIPDAWLDTNPNFDKALHQDGFAVPNRARGRRVK